MKKNMKLLFFAFGLFLCINIFSQSPANDFSPQLIQTNLSVTGTTCGATRNINEIYMCEAGHNVSTVWYEFRANSDTKLVQFQFDNIDIPSNVSIEIYEGIPGQSSDGNFSPLVDPYCIIVRSTINYELKCIDFNNSSIYVKVATSIAKCGSFTIKMNAIAAFGGHDSLGDAVASNKADMIINTGNLCSTSGTFTNIDKCSESDDCDFQGASTWIKIDLTNLQNDEEEISISIQDALFEPILSAHGNNSFAFLVSCEKNSIAHIKVKTKDYLYLKVEAKNGVNLGQFKIMVCKYKSTDYFNCYTHQLRIERPENPSAPWAGPFLPNEIIKICPSINFIVSPIGTVPPYGNNCQWLHAIMPNFINGIDVEASNLPSQILNDTAKWYNQDIVEYNIENNYFSLVTLTTGRKVIDYLSSDTNYLSPGSPLPGAYWYNSSGSGCINDGDPDNSWGFQAGCGSNVNFNTCFNVKIDQVDKIDCQNPKIKFNILALPDGETGCWTNPYCIGTIPIIFEGLIDCGSTSTNLSFEYSLSNFKLEKNKTNIVLNANEKNKIIILNTDDNPNVTGETLKDTFLFGSVYITDSLVNLTTEPQIVNYRFKAKDKFGYFYTEEIVVPLTVPAKLKVNLSESKVCFGECTKLSPIVTGGSSIDKSYIWSTGETSQTINVCPNSSRYYFITVTDNDGNTASQQAFVEVTGDNKPALINFFADQINIFNGEQKSFDISTNNENNGIEISTVKNDFIDNGDIIDTILFSSTSLNIMPTNIGPNYVETYFYKILPFRINTACYGDEEFVTVKVSKGLAVRFNQTMVCQDSCFFLTPLIDGDPNAIYSYNWSTGSDQSGTEVCPEVLMSYHVTVTDQNNFSTIGEVEVSVKKPNNVLVFDDSTLEVKSGESFFIKFTFTNPTSKILIYSEANNNVDGIILRQEFEGSNMEIPQNLIITSQDTVENVKYYFLTFDDELNCYSDPLSITIKINKETTSINDFQNQELLILPNPVNNAFKIIGNVSKVHKVVLRDIHNKLIYEFDTEDVLNNTYHIANLVNGLYFVEIELGNKKVNLKLIKQ